MALPCAINAFAASLLGLHQKCDTLLCLDSKRRPAMARDRSPEAAEKAKQLFRASEQRDQAIRNEIEKERVAVAAKTAKLRALRLAKEASDRADAAANPTASPAKPRPARKSRKA